MFKNLSKWELKRNWKQAIGFYIAYFVQGFILLYILLIPYNPNDFTENLLLILISSLTIIIYSMTLSFLILNKKRMIVDKKNIFLLLMTGIISYVGGIFLGLIIPAYLTTLEDKNKTEKPKE